MADNASPNKLSQEISAPGTQYHLERNSSEYLAQLLRDRRTLSYLPNMFTHIDRILKDEIEKVRLSLFNSKGDSRDELLLPDPLGPAVTKSEKLFVPVKEYPDFNFVGRILGPRGMTAKQLEQDTGCKIMIRGRGSMRDKAKEEQNRGKPNWEHLSDELHVLISVDDTIERAEIKLNKAILEIRKLLLPSSDGEDELKKMQLMELAILNGTYRNDANTPKNVYGRSYSYDTPTSPLLMSQLRSSAVANTMYFGTRTSGINNSTNSGTNVYNGQSSQQPIVGVLGYISQSGYPPFVADMNNLYYVDPYMINSAGLADYTCGTTNGNYN